VGQKYAISWVAKQSTPKNPVGEIAALLKRFGLSTKRSKSVSQLASLVTKRGKSETKKERENTITVMGFAAMEERLQRRIETALAIEAKERDFVDGCFWSETPHTPPEPAIYVVNIGTPDLGPERPEVCEPMTFEANLPAANGDFDMFEVTRTGELLKVWDAAQQMSCPMMFAAE